MFTKLRTNLITLIAFLLATVVSISGTQLIFMPKKNLSNKSNKKKPKENSVRIEMIKKIKTTIN
jgi:hypothetical protein